MGRLNQKMIEEETRLSQDKPFTEFRGFHDKDDNNELIAVFDLELPAKPDNRTATDKYFIVAYACFLTITIAFMIYTLTKFESNNANYIFLEEMVRFEIIILVVSIFLSMGVLALLGYCTASVVWTTMVLAMLILFFGITFFIFRLINQASEGAYDIVPIFALMAVLILSSFLFRRLEFTILLFKEVLIALFAMPMFLLITIIYTLAIVGMATTFFVIEILMLIVYYNQGNGVHVVGLILNVLLMVWTLLVLYAFQCMLVSNSIATW